MTEDRIKLWEIPNKGRKFKILPDHIIIHLGKKYNDTNWSSLNPYYITDSNGYKLLNIWNFSAVYEKFEKPYKYVFNENINWEWGKDMHYDRQTEQLDLEKYMRWREFGIRKKISITRVAPPKHKPIFWLWNSKNYLFGPSGKWKVYGSRQAKCLIFWSCYYNLIKDTKEYKELAQMVADGKKIIFAYPQTYQVDPKRKYMGKFIIPTKQTLIESLEEPDELNYIMMLGYSLLNHQEPQISPHKPS